MTTDPAGRVDIADRLWSSDVASALTNEAAREIERLRTALIEVRAAILNENGLNEMSISDTVWVSPIETAVDCIDAALAPAEGEKTSTETNGE